MASQRLVSPACPSVSGIDRRSLFKSGLLGAALSAVPVSVSAMAERGFSHGVASGEPGAGQVLLWTRYLADEPVRLRYEVSTALDFGTIAAGGEAEASPARDGCVKPVATGLAPDRWYYYRFIAPDGAISDIGRTRTLPEDQTARFRLAMVGCSNFGFGWFNAYAHITRADETDLVVHTGDYIYEYGVGTYPTMGQAAAGRAISPATEIVALADYRARYATYRSDADLQRLHQMFPMIAIPDDHESANDAYRDGAENHDPVTEGSWDARKRAAMQAYREWMPISDEPWAKYDIGNLATIFRLETRLTARSKQFDVGAILLGAGGDAERMKAALANFRDNQWRDPARGLLGAAQEAWLAEGLKASRSAGKVWQVLAQQVIMANLSLPAGLADGLSDALPANVRALVAGTIATSEAGLPFNMDAWDGYPAARERLLTSAQDANANLLVLAGDSHNGWASQLDNMGAPAGIEFAGHSVTSPGAESYLPWIKPEDFARDVVARNPQLLWANTGARGYVVLELTANRAVAEYRFLETIRQRSTVLASSKRITSEAGSQTLVVD